MNDSHKLHDAIWRQVWSEATPEDHQLVREALRDDPQAVSLHKDVRTADRLLADHLKDEPELESRALAALEKDLPRLLANPGEEGATRPRLLPWIGLAAAAGLAILLIRPLLDPTGLDWSPTRVLPYGTMGAETVATVWPDDTVRDLGDRLRASIQAEYDRGDADLPRWRVVVFGAPAADGSLSLTVKAEPLAAAGGAQEWTLILQRDTDFDRARGDFARLIGERLRQPVSAH